MICPSCGGDYADWALKCPYCDTVNEKADEQRYLDHLEDLRKRLDQVDEESENLYQDQVKHSLSRVGKILGIVVGIVFGIFLIVITVSNFTERREENTALAQQKWEQEEFKKLDAWYDSGDLDQIIEEYYNLISDSDQPFHIYHWPHYLFVCEYYENHKEIESSLAELAAGQIPNPFTLGRGLYSSLQLIMENTDTDLERLIETQDKYDCYGLTEKEAEIVKTYRADAQLLLQSIGMSEINAKENYENWSEDGFLSMSSCFDWAEAYGKENRP